MRKRENGCRVSKRWIEIERVRERVKENKRLKSPKISGKSSC